MYSYIFFFFRFWIIKSAFKHLFFNVTPLSDSMWNEPTHGRIYSTIIHITVMPRNNNGALNHHISIFIIRLNQPSAIYNQYLFIIFTNKIYYRYHNVFFPFKIFQKPIILGSVKLCIFFVSVSWQRITFFLELSKKIL